MHPLPTHDLLSNQTNKYKLEIVLILNSIKYYIIPPHVLVVSAPSVWHPKSSISEVIDTFPDNI